MSTEAMFESSSQVTAGTRVENHLLYDIISAYIEALGGSVSVDSHDLSLGWAHPYELKYTALIPKGQVHKLGPFVGTVNKLLGVAK